MFHFHGYGRKGKYAWNSTYYLVLDTTISHHIATPQSKLPQIGNRLFCS